MLDAHVHCWQLGRHGCAWPPPALTSIHRDFGVDDWARVATPEDVDACIVVQSQADDRDTDWLLQLAHGDARVAGVVGWVDLSARAAPTRIAAIARQPKLCGLRPMLQDLPEDDWILRPALAPAIEAMLEHGLCFDALVYPRHLPHLLCFAERYPQLTIVIDHAAKPAIARGAFEAWRDGVTALAALPHVACKLSGLVTEAGAAWRPDDLRPYAEHLLATFGPERLLWGSDWPVVTLAADYARWFRAANTLTDLDGPARAALFGGNAARIYAIQSPRGNSRATS